MNLTHARRSRTSRNPHRAGLALVACAVVAAVLIALNLESWSNDPSTADRLLGGLFGRPSLALQSPALTPAQNNPAAMPRSRTGLVLTSQNRGQVLFGRYCDSCHTAGREFSGPSFRTVDFKSRFTSTESIEKIVRVGGFDMPAFSDSLISDDDLHEIIQYVLALPQDNP